MTWPTDTVEPLAPPSPPSKLAHIVLRTARFDETVAWYKTVLMAEPRFENDTISFLTYDDEHHRMAIIGMGELADDGRRSAGMEHVAFTYPDIDRWLATYERLRDDPTVAAPTPIHHGMTMSLYYRDPDRNQVELQIDVMSIDEAESFMASDVFAANPIGVPFDPDDLADRRRGGASVEDLTVYTPA